MAYGTKPIDQELTLLSLLLYYSRLFQGKRRGGGFGDFGR